MLSYVHMAPIEAKPLLTSKKVWPLWRLWKTKKCIKSVRSFGTLRTDLEHFSCGILKHILGLYCTVLHIFGWISKGFPQKKTLEIQQKSLEHCSPPPHSPLKAEIFFNPHFINNFKASLTHYVRTHKTTRLTKEWKNILTKTSF